MTAMNNTNKEQGFSLVEMVAAIAILALVGLLIGTSVNIFYRSYSQAQKIGSELRRNQAIDRIAEGYLANAVPFPWLNEQSETKYVFLGEYGELYLTALRRTYAESTGALRFIRLYLDDEALKCDYSPTPLLPWRSLDDQKYDTEIITDGVRRISFQYAEINDGVIEWTDTWVEDDHNGIPLAIQLTVEWLDGTKERWLRRTAGSSGNSTYGDREEPSS